MNFDDIKKAMDDEPTDLTIPLSVKDIKSSHSAMRKIRNRLIFEIIFGLVFIAYLICIPYINPLHRSAEVLYVLTIFNAIMAYFGWILSGIRLIRGLRISDLTSRQSIELFIIKIKSWIEVGKYFGFGIMATFAVPILIIELGSVRVPEYYTDKYLYLNFPLEQIVMVIAVILLFSLLITVLSMKMYSKMYKIQLQKLEKIIRQFN